MTFDKVAKLLADRIGADVTTIKLESTFEELGIDSLDVMELLMLLEDEFGREIEIGDNKIKDVAGLVAFIDSTGAQG